MEQKSKQFEPDATISGSAYFFVDYLQYVSLSVI